MRAARAWLSLCASVVNSLYWGSVGAIDIRRRLPEHPRMIARVALKSRKPGPAGAEGFRAR
jgi:hypothetical protein